MIGNAQLGIDQPGLLQLAKIMPAFGFSPPTCPYRPARYEENFPSSPGKSPSDADNDAVDSPTSSPVKIVECR